MKRIGCILLCFITLVSEARAQTVQVWTTLLDDGSAREQKMGLSGFGVEQDDGYVLLQKQPPLRFGEKSTESELTIAIDPHRTYQTIHGLGAAMTDSSAWVLHRLKANNPQLYAYVMNRLFSNTGAGLSVLRCPIGSSDYTATAESYTYQDDPSIFSIGHDKQYIIPVLKDARRINGAIQIIASPWSAPAFMKTNGDLNGITAADKEQGKTNRLKPECFASYADYFVNFLQGYATQGVAVAAVTLQNEPQFDAAHYPCMRMTLDDQIKLVRLLGPRLERAGLDTRILVHDHNWRLHPNDQKVVGGDVKLDPYELVKRIYNHPTAGPLVSGSAWHCYSGSAADMQRLYEQLAREFPDKQIYCTEATGWRDYSQTDWPGDCFWGLRHNWLGGLAAGASVALQWNLALDQQHGPTTRDDSLATGLVTVDTETWNSARFEREFYAMAHVSKAVRPGSVRADVSVDNGGGDLLVLSTLRPDGSIALVVCNSRSASRRCEVSCDGRYLVLEAPARSLTTLAWDRAQAVE